MSKKLISLTDAEKEISKFFGDDTVFFDGDINLGSVEVISSGSPSLDSAIGVGGLPRGRVIQLAGQESSGKTMLALSCIKNYLDLNPDNNALFIDAEYTYDPEWAASLGVDVNRVMVIKTNDAKKIFDGLIGLPPSSGSRSGKKRMKGILDHIAEGNDPRFKNMGIIVLDSIAVLSTPTEISSEAGKQNIASVARFLSSELKKLTPEVAKANVAFIGINQVRVNIGQMYGDPTSSPGGKALKHACSLMINMAPILSSDSRILNENGERIGHKVRAKIGKNKVGSPFKQAEYSIEYTKGIVNLAEDLLNACVEKGIVKRPNNRTYEFFDKKISGRDSVISHIQENENSFEMLKEALYANLKNIEVSIEDEEIDNPLLSI